MDFKATVEGALAQLIESGKIEEAIADQLEKTVTDVIKAELREWSDFGKQIQAAVKQSLKVDTDLGLPAYNELIVKIVRAKVQNQVGGAIETQIAEQMAELLEPAPESIPLSEIAKQYRSFLEDKRQGDCHCDSDSDSGNQFTFEVETGVSGYRHIYFDEESGKSRWQCAIQISADAEGKVYALSLDREDVGKRLFAGPFWGFERSLFQMRAAGTRIEFDVEPCDVDTYLSTADY